MGTEDVGRTGIAAMILLAAALISLPARTADAACSAESRVDHRDAECLYAWWKNRGLLRKSPYHVSNQCSAYGKVVAKVDLVSADDRTIHLDDAFPRDGDTSHRIRGISCCSDTGALCNRSDVVTDTGCLSRFRRTSSAAWSCMNHTAAAAISGDNYNCTVRARCKTGEFLMDRPVYSNASITVAWLDLDDVHNCGGTLKRGSCSRSRTGAPSLSLGDARAAEGGGASLEFKVTLSRPHPEPVTVRYATSDGTATAGSDYIRTSGTLAFAANETSKTVSVPVLDDDHDEHPETLTLALFAPAPSHVRLADAEATGTIANTDRMPKAWLARFGRTVADQVLDAVDDRMQAKPAPGVEARLAGQRIGYGPAFAAGPRGDPTSGEGLAPDLGQRSSERELLPPRSFSLTAETGDRGLISIWGRGAVTGFAGRDAASAEAGGNEAVDGEVATGMLGADWTRGRWTTGLLVTRSRGDGAYRGAGGGTVSATLTALWPWVGHSLGERLSVWGVAGYGDGRLTLEPRAEDGTHAGAIRTDLDLWMAAVGLRGVALDGGDDGVSLAVKTDAMTAHTASDAVAGSGGNLAVARAEVARLRLGLEGSRRFRLGDGSALTPSVEIGLRYDSGDAETGFGADIGAGAAWRDAERGLGAELRGRGLFAHEAEGFRERGLSASFVWIPAVGGRGPQLSVMQTVGVAARRGADALLDAASLAKLAANDTGHSPYQRRLEARFGYGFAAFADSFTSTPEIAVGLSHTGRDYSLGWRLVRRARSGDTGSLELSLEVRRREGTKLGAGSGAGSRAAHETGFRITARY